MFQHILLSFRSKNEIMEESTLIANSKTILSACCRLLGWCQSKDSFQTITLNAKTMNRYYMSQQYSKKKNCQDQKQIRSLCCKCFTSITYNFVLLFAEAKRTEKSYEALLHAFSHSHDNLEVLRLIFNVNDDSEEIFKYGGVSI